MERVELPIHSHPLIPLTRFHIGICAGCQSYGFIYGGYRCNELGCDTVVFHKECAESLAEINHPSHPNHTLKLNIQISEPTTCSFCKDKFKVGYFCSICDFKLDLYCARRSPPLLILEKSNAHEHPLTLCEDSDKFFVKCKACGHDLFSNKQYYRCYQSGLVFHVECVDIFPEPYHTSHPQHPLKLLLCIVPKYADKMCLLCGIRFGNQKYHCDVCNVSICDWCMRDPPPVDVVSPKTHEHELHLVPRCIDFTCNVCGTQGDRSPYFCLQCNFMIHRDCIDLPRVININRHDHRISYTPHLGHGEWTACGVCRKKVDGFYGAYTCVRCPSYAVHSRCATSKKIWDMIERDGTPEEEIIAPFEVIDENTIKHFSHDHNLRINKEGMILHESILCEACVFQICSEPFYSCEQCSFILHEKCANLPRKKRHVCSNQPFTLHTDYPYKTSKCFLCEKMFTGFRYMSDRCLTLDVRCASILEPFVHESHPHPLYFDSLYTRKLCSGCKTRGMLSCDECDFSLNFSCAMLPQKVMRLRYDDHPLSLSFGESSVDGVYWCEACETKVNPKKWFYTCNDCGVVLHIFCVVGSLSNVMPGSVIRSDKEVVSNTSICRPLCFACNSKCKLPSAYKRSEAGVVKYLCCFNCEYNIPNNFSY